MRYLLLCLLLPLVATAEVRKVRTENTLVVVNTDYVMVVESWFEGATLFYSRAQGKVISLHPAAYASTIAQGIRNGNLRPVNGTPVTRILLRREANVQMAMGGGALLSGGDATNVNQPAEVIIRAPIDEVLAQLYPKTP